MKIEFSLFSLVIIILVAVGGCQEGQQAISESLIRSNPQEQLVKSPPDWIERYGDSLESQQTANIVLVIQVINRQGEAIKQLNERLVVLEVGDVIDPNGVK